MKLLASTVISFTFGSEEPGLKPEGVELTTDVTHRPEGLSSTTPSCRETFGTFCVMNGEMHMHAILIHGMGRTPIAMSILAARLRAADIRPHLFGYSVTFERWDECIQRLEYFITKRVKTNEYIMIGHSLGSVLTRATLPRLIHQPAACFFLASPTEVCKAARNFAHYHVAKLLMGEIGQRLADNQFMESLPATGVPAKIYAGTGGPRGRYSPFGKEPNDGVLTVKETLLPSVPVQTIPVLHTFIMNSKIVSQDIVKIAKSHPTIDP